MKKEIIRLAEEEKEKPKKAREKAKKEDELKSEELQKQLKKFTKKIDKTKVDEISSIKQQELAIKKGHSELKLKDEVQTYKFSKLITDWEDKARSNPVRGELDPNDLSNLDNNALFYGAPRTGKSVMAEKMAYEANIYPLVTIQGSTLTPKKSDNDVGATLLIKFIFTISDITHKLVEDFGYERAEGDGEVRYILFLDEADQVCTTHLLPPKDASSQLTFLKECMGADSKDEEREFMEYAKDAGISHQFPQHSSQLDNFDGKFVNPRQPKIEEVIKESSTLAANHISKTINTRLKQIDETITKIEDELTAANTAYSQIMKKGIEEIATLLSTIGEKIKKNQAREDNRLAREEEKKARDALEEQERKNKELEKELEQARNKVNDPNLSEEERAQ
ncbi:46273_t:CDS:2 [Gigaspora margarita]|uniref:46273_t:CDS:1 n=1 Tax=Gigaspora margarita TaxID=4874 RepID=A0ABN7VZD8_GIGMA|nr:46273_t:CDS:2 [Gigaspora margarita]